MIFSFTRLYTKLRHAFALISLDKLIQLISLGPHVQDLDWGEITDLHTFPKKSLGRVLSWFNLIIQIQRF